MKIKILQENIFKALSRITRITPPRPQLPILLTIKLSATKEGVELTATNLETTETIWVGAKVEEEGSICVTAKTLLDFVATLPAETITLESKEEQLHITCAGFRATLPTAQVTEFPPVVPFVQKVAGEVQKDLFVQALSLVLFAAATDESRPILTGIRTMQQDKETVFVATDGYRLSLKKISLQLNNITQATIPARALSEVVKLSHEEKEEQSLLVGPAGTNQIGIKIGETTVTTRLLDGEYPNFERIIPKTHTTQVAIEKEPFLRAVRSASIFARENANIVRLEVVKDKITVSAAAAQIGKNTIEIPSSTEGDGGEIAFNSRFLLDFLMNFPEEEFLFQMTGALNSGVFRPVKDDSYLHIIMPVRVTNT